MELFRSNRKDDLIIVLIGDIHNIDGLLNGHTFFGPKDYGRFFLPFQCFFQFNFYILSVDLLVMDIIAKVFVNGDGNILGIRGFSL